MNLKKVVALCKNAKKFHVINIVSSDRPERTVTNQWIMLGPAAYQIGNSGFTSQMLAQVAGVENSAFSSIKFQDEDRVISDWMKDFPVQEDQKAMWATISLVMDHREIRLFRSYTGGSILPINCAYLAPVDNECDYYIRQGSKSPMLAIKNGLFIEALILPYDIFGEKDGIKLLGIKSALENERGIWE